MTRTEALDRAVQEFRAVDMVTCSGSDGTHWYLSHRVPSGAEWTQRLVWTPSALCPRGGFWNHVSVDLEPEGVDWVPGRVEREVRGEERG